MKTHTTIKDIARELNIHHTTVSRALRDHPDVNTDTRALILKTAEQMNYSPNTFATSLRSQQSTVIGVIVPSVQPFFFSSMISKLSKKADEAGYTIMIFQSDEDFEIEKRNVMALLQNRVAGLIVSIASETDQFDHFTMLEEQGTPVIFFDRVPPDPKVNCVRIDNYHGAYGATEYLISKGREDIAFFAGPKDVSIFHDRLEGYMAALRDHNRHIRQDRIFRSNLSIEAGRNTMQQLIGSQSLPDAILCAVDLLAFGAMGAAQHAHLAIPDDVALIGFDNHPAGEIVQPALTTVAQPIDRIAEQAFQLLIRLIEGDKSGTAPDSDPLKMELLIRESA